LSLECVIKKVLKGGKLLKKEKNRRGEKLEGEERGGA